MFNKKEVTEEFIILIISSGLAMDAVSNRIMVKKIKSCKPSYWCLRHPDGYLVYFRTTNKKFTKRANKLYNAIVELIKRNNNFEDYKIGQDKGKFACELSFFGKITSEPEPLDDTANKAYKEQKGKSDFIKPAE